MAAVGGAFHNLRPYPSIRLFQRRLRGGAAQTRSGARDAPPVGSLCATRQFRQWTRSALTASSMRSLPSRRPCRRLRSIGCCSSPLAATHTFNGLDPRLGEKVREVTDGGIDHALDFAGALPAMKSAYTVTVRVGRMTTSGLAPARALLSVEQGDLVSNYLRLLLIHWLVCRCATCPVSLYRKGQAAGERATGQGDRLR